MSHERYWNWYHQVDENLTYSDAVDAYHELLTNAVRRCLASGTAILPISGGLDSRSIAAVADNTRLVQSYSYGYTNDSIETRIARQVAEACGFKFKFTKHVIGPYLFNRIEEITSALHGCQDITQARQMSVNQWVSERADVILTGLMGDLWCDQMGLASSPTEDVVGSVMKKYTKRGHQHLIAGMLGGGGQVDNVSEYLVDQIKSGLYHLEHINDLDFRLKALKASQWVFRWSNASLRGFELGAIPRIPYYDIDLVDFFCRLPTNFVQDRRIQIDHLKRYAPQLANIKWQQSGTNLYQVHLKKQ